MSRGFDEAILEILGRTKEKVGDNFPIRVKLTGDEFIGVVSHWEIPKQSHKS